MTTYDVEGYDRGGQAMCGDYVSLGDHQEAVASLQSRIDELETLINHPHNDDWFEGTKIEAAYQVELWGAEHDAGKKPEDWFWLIGYLAGKCVRAHIAGDTEKAKHHTISTAAALLNWHRAVAGKPTAMRPGIDGAPA